MVRLQQHVEEELGEQWGLTFLSFLSFFLFFLEKRKRVLMFWSQTVFPLGFLEDIMQTGGFVPA